MSLHIETAVYITARRMLNICATSDTLAVAVEWAIEAAGRLVMFEGTRFRHHLARVTA